jgi:hypothetical protein
MIETSTRSKVMYKVGGISLVIVGISYIVGAVLSLIIGPAPSDALDYLNALSAHRLLSMTNFAFFTLADVFIVPAAITLYITLKDTNKPAMLTASTLMIVFAVFDAGITELNSFQLVALSQNLAAATSEAQRSAIMLTVNSIQSTLPIITLCSFVISSIGLAITAAVMVKGAFSKRATLPGLTAGVAGTLGGFYIIVPILSVLMVPSIIAMGIWGIFAGRAIQKMK